MTTDEADNKPPCKAGFPYLAILCTENKKMRMAVWDENDTLFVSFPRDMYFIK